MHKVLTILPQAKSVLGQFKNDEKGAALIEYTVLLGILMVAVIAIITLVGAWVNNEWHALQTRLS